MKKPKCRKPKMNLSQPEVALAAMAAHWNWLASNSNNAEPREVKLRWPGFNYWGYGIRSACILCEYGKLQGGRQKCYYCLIPAWRAWPTHKCLVGQSIYKRWCTTRSKEAALAIRDMALTELVRHHWKRLALKSFCYTAKEGLYRPITNAGRMLQSSYEIYAPNRAVDGTYYFGYGVQAIYGWRLHDPSTWLCLTSQQYTIARSVLSCTHFLINSHVASALSFWESAEWRKRKANEQELIFKEFLPIMPLTNNNCTALIKLINKVKETLYAKT